MEQPQAGNDQGPTTSIATGNEYASALDYLEKIFQVPFWLPPMEPDASRNLITGLVPIVERSQTKDDSEVRAVPPLASDTADRPVERESIVEDLRTRPAPGAQAESGSPSDVEVENGGLETAQQPTEADKDPAISPPDMTEPAGMLAVEPEEREFMLSLASAIGKSPRRLKRFVNTYRILKATCTPQERKGFVLNSGRDGEYKAAMALLAISTGAPPLAPQLFSELFKKRNDDKVSDLLHADFADKLKAGSDADRKNAADALKIYASQWKKPATLKDLRYWGVRVSRFTFRS
jgi:hypothetical protein